MTTRFSDNEWRIIGLTSVGHALCHISELAFAAVLIAVMAEFALSPDHAAALAVPGFVLYGVGAIPAGLWTDRRGSREVLIVYFLAVAASSLMVVCARSAWQVGGALTALGAAISLYHPAGLGMISHGCTQRGRALGINGVAGSVGISLGPAIGLTLASYGHWRAIYVVVAICAILSFLFAIILKMDIEPHLAKTSDLPNSTVESPRMNVPVLALLFAAMMLGGINYRCLTTALPTFLNAGQHVAETPAAGSESGSGSPSVAADGIESEDETLDGNSTRWGGALLFFVLALGGVGQMIGGHLADRCRPAVVYAIMIGLTIPCALMMAHGNPPLVGLAAGMLAIFMFAQQPLENLMIAHATPASWRSTVYGIKFVFAFGVASIGAYLTGWVWNRFSLPVVFDVFAILAACMATLASLYAVASRNQD